MIAAKALSIFALRLSYLSLLFFGRAEFLIRDQGLVKEVANLGYLVIPSAQRFVWAAKQGLGKAAWGALFA